MKKMKICASVCLISLFGSLFAAPKKVLELEPVVIDLPSKTTAEFTYAIDPRVEIVSILCRLAEFQEFSLNYQGENEFLSQIDTLFEKYKNHKLVKTLKSYKKQGISGSAFLNLAYHINPDFSGTTVPMNPYPKDLNPELKKLSPKQLNKLVTQIHDFVIESKFSRICTLNQATYQADLGWIVEDYDKLNIHSWGKNFFNNPNVKDVTVTISRICCGYYFYDYATGKNGPRNYYLTISPGTNYLNFIQMYSLLYTQDYASRNWDKVKDNYISYIKDFNKKLYPDREKEIDNQEVYDSSLASTISLYTLIAFCQYKIQNQTEETIKKYGDFAQIYDSIVQIFEKSYGKEASKAIELLENYSANRQKYVNLLSYENEINAFVNSLGN
ncbi:MAG: DUF4932 domain-containing protein [Treponema sp.]|nr:DUF4932 domain-containing protein [Treponema sp.]